MHLNQNGTSTPCVNTSKYSTSTTITSAKRLVAAMNNIMRNRQHPYTHSFIGYCGKYCLATGNPQQLIPSCLSLEHVVSCPSRVTSMAFFIHDVFILRASCYRSLVQRTGMSCCGLPVARQYFPQYPIYNFGFLLLFYFSPIAEILVT
jgi:hypothetical protein